MMKLSVYLATSVLMIFLGACGPRQTSSISGDRNDYGVNLGTKGNNDAADRFQKYTQKNGGCKASTNSQRVLLTGFGLFDSEYNISGLVVENMSSDKFWPSKSKISDSVPVDIKKVADGTLKGAEASGIAINRTLTIDEKTYDVCFLILDVRWDVAAAIIVHEMQRFQPNLVVMTGRSGRQAAVIEGAAQNRTMIYGGFFNDGKMDTINTPKSENENVLPANDAGVQQIIRMSWDNKELQRATSNLIDQLGYKVDAPSTPSDSSTYVCNNVAFVANHAALGVTLNLAGGQIVLKPNIKSAPQIGFFHYPITARNSAKEVYGWSKVLASIISSALMLK